jgi:hypothetical protein
MDVGKLVSLLVVLIVFTSIYTIFFDKHHFNGIDKEDNIIEKIENRLYFTLTTMSTVGYGDITPKSLSCRMVTSVLMGIVILGLITTVVTIKKKNSSCRARTSDISVNSRTL